MKKDNLENTIAEIRRLNKTIEASGEKLSEEQFNQVRGDLATLTQQIAPLTKPFDELMSAYSELLVNLHKKTKQWPDFQETILTSAAQFRVRLQQEPAISPTNDLGNLDAIIDETRQLNEFVQSNQQLDKQGFNDLIDRLASLYLRSTQITDQFVQKANELESANTELSGNIQAHMSNWPEVQERIRARVAMMKLQATNMDEMAWELPEKLPQLKIDACAVGIVAALSGYPDVARDPETLEARARAALVVVRSTNRGIMTNDFAMYSAVFIRWFQMGYLWQVKLFDDDPGSIEKERQALVDMSPEQTLEYMKIRATSWVDQVPEQS